MTKLTNMHLNQLDKDTFCLTFDGGIDEDDDEYYYSVEYHKDENRFTFERVYEDDVMQADFTNEQMEYLKTILLKNIA